MSEEQKQAQEVDLVTKVSSFKEEVKEEDKGVQPLEKVATEFKTVEEAVEWAKNKEKEWASGYGKKFQDLAEQRKELEKQMTEAKLWTPERVQQLLNDQTFVAAAQSVMQSQNPPNSGKSDEEWSTLTDGEKKRIMDLQNEINLLKKQNYESSTKQQDEMLKSKYANYNAELVAKLKDDLINNRIVATNEHLWKVADYESAVERAYKLGRKDEKELKREKVDNFSFDSMTSKVEQEGRLSPDKIIPLQQLYNHHKQQKEANQLRQ